MLPEAGDIAWVDLDPTRGTEQAGRRPALVVSDSIYNAASRRAVICPITRAERSWPFNVPLPVGLKTRGAVLVDQIRTIERADRMFGIIERAPFDLLAEVRGRLAALLSFDLVSSVADPN